MNATEILNHGLDVNFGIASRPTFLRLARIHGVSKADLRDALEQSSISYENFNGLTYLYRCQTQFDKWKASHPLSVEQAPPAYDDIDRFMEMDL